LLVVLPVKIQRLLQAVLKCNMYEKIGQKRGAANDLAAPHFYYALFNEAPDRLNSGFPVKLCILQQ
jgi:hypothetical protein